MSRAESRDPLKGSRCQLLRRPGSGAGLQPFRFVLAQCGRWLVPEGLRFAHAHHRAQVAQFAIARLAFDQQRIQFGLAAVGLQQFAQPLRLGRFSSGWICNTPDFKDIEKILTAGADIIALDVTPRKRPNGLDGIEFFEEVRNKFTAPLIADISTFEEGIRAAEMGADAIATTLSGYTEQTQHRLTDVPDFQLIEELARAVKIPVIAQGKIWTPLQAKDALDRGAFCVVAGTAIARPREITKKFITTMNAKIN